MSAVLNAGFRMNRQHEKCHSRGSIPRLAPGFVLISGLLLFITGCATLPKVSDVMQEVPPDRPLQVAAADNTRMSACESQALLAQVRQSPDPVNLLERHLAVMQYMSGMPLIEGNSLLLLTNVQSACDAMLEAMRTAKEHIHLEAYKIDDDVMGRRFRDLLVQKRQEGVREAGGTGRVQSGQPG